MRDRPLFCDVYSDEALDETESIILFVYSEVALDERVTIVLYCL